MGDGPGRTTTADQPAGRAGSTPAWTKELLPAPDGPITTRSGWTRSRLTKASVSRSRPTKLAASSRPKAARPG